MTNQNHSPGNFIRDVNKYLEDRDYASALSAFNDAQHQEFLKNNSWDLIPVLCKHITKEARLKNHELATCCEVLLEKLAAKADPEEAVLEFLDQMDEADSEKFDVVLKLLKIIFNREMNNRIKSLEWTLNSIRSYMEHYSYDSCDENLDEPVSTDQDDEFYSSDKLREIEFVMNSVIVFFEDFVREASESPDAKELRCLLSSRLLQMFDIFLPYINIELYPQFKVLQCRVSQLLLQLVSNPMSLLEFVFYRSLNIMKQKSDDSTKATKQIQDTDFRSASLQDINPFVNSNPFEDETVVSNLAYGMFFYSLLTETENEQTRVPLVYNPKYIMLSLIYVTVPFFDKKTDIAIGYGLKFLNFLLDQLSDFLTKPDLYFSSHKAILIHLNNVMVFSQVEENRKLALTCFKKYIESFNWEGRYLLLLNFRCHVHHSGTLGFLISLLKDFVSTFLELPLTSQSTRKFLKYYKGKLLFDMIRKYCYLSNGTNTDLVESADHIISSLNALRYLVLRDKKNVTDIRNFIKKIDKDFLKPLKENITSSKNFYDLKLKDLESSASNSSIASNESDIDVELTVKGVRVNHSFRYCSTKDEPQSTQNESENEEYEKSIREKILKASLQFVSKHGWSKDALSHGAESLGYPGIANGIFPNGGADLINYFYVECNKELKNYMIEVTGKSEKPVKPKDFIRNSVEVRLRMLIPYIDRWPQAIAVMSLPPNVPVALANLLTLVDDICYYAGDKSVDFNWYTRRVGVGGIYKMSELYMLQDKSLDYKETWNFLDRRLTEAFQIQQVLDNSSEATTVAKDVVASAFITARNILRLNVPR